MSALSGASRRQLLTPDFNPPNKPDDPATLGTFYRASSAVSASDINFPKVFSKSDEVGEQTLYQVEISNEKLQRKAYRSELASKKKCLTRRWQTALAVGLLLGSLAIGLGAIGYWMSIPKSISQPYLLYGESCYMNSRSCDETRLLWCPAGTCICTSNFKWNATIQNCTCGAGSTYNGFRCQGLGYYGDPCTYVGCHATLTCTQVANQTYTTGQFICVCDNATYLDTISGSATVGQCVPRLPYNSSCLAETDCQDWLGLQCLNMSGSSRCGCDPLTSYWDPSAGICKSKVLGWDPCNSSVPCDTTRGLTCVSGYCECDAYSFWDNVTTKYCQTLKTYAVTCQYDFQCNQTVNLSCPSTSTGCNCYATSYAGMCDCQLGNFWDGLRCTPVHIFNGTCPGQYACSSNLVCYLGHCICPGNMQWGVVTAGQCDCAPPTVWSNTTNECK
ncbi:unnamed protein product [Adineta ricciae]|uniref:EGF-like domain-containing protein n=1 Tax=Adineta ricciae TaxID=249248 RepID=A0A815TGW0_ADIRI|nr:unnamed protein product [Adineta ricciae]